MAASKVKFSIEQGATWTHRLVWAHGTVRNPVPFDLTGYTARMQVREFIESPTVLLSLTTENGRIAIDGPAGSIQMVLSAVDTAAFTWQSGVYDLELVAPGGDVTRLVKGSVRVSPEVTR